MGFSWPEAAPSNGPGRSLTGFISDLKRAVTIRAVAAALVTTVTLALIAGIAILSTTSLGCGPAARLGLKGITSSCKTTATVIALASPTPSPYPGYQSPVAPPSVSAPYIPPASAPYTPTPPAPGPDSPPYPPYFPPLAGGGSPASTYPLSCRLPVITQQFPTHKGGFIQFPAGNYVADPASEFPVPAGTIQFGLTYDAAYSRWLPVPRAAVSPDGSRYVYGTPDGYHIHVVTLATGVDVTMSQSLVDMTVFSVGSAGVYAKKSNQPGLWFLPYAGGVQQVTPSGFWMAATESYAFGSIGEVPGGVVLRLDLATGAIVDWSERLPGSAYVRGLDTQGNPVIQDVITNPQQVYLIAGGPAGIEPLFGWTEGISSIWEPVSDSHGTWLNASTPSGSSILLFVRGSGLYWMAASQGLVAGGCS